MLNNKNYFTLIEIIVAIVVIGILVSITIPVVSTIQEKARAAQIQGDTESMQLAVDTYNLKNNGYPVEQKPTADNPQTVALKQIHPNYIRNLPQHRDLYYWVDDKGTVSISSEDAPYNVSYANGTLSWTGSDTVETYNIYKNKIAVSGAANGNRDKELVQEFKNTEKKILLSTPLPSLPADEQYVISSIDVYGIESPLVGSNYKGGNLPLDKHSLQMNGHNSYIDMGTIDTPKSFTIEAMINPKDNVNPWMRIMQRANADGKGFSLGYHYGKVHFQVRDYGSGVYVAESQPLDLNKWYKITAVYKKGDAPRLYIDGVLQTGHQDDADYIYGDGGGNAFHISKRANENIYYFEGEIDEIRIWNRVLTPKEIRRYQHSSVQGVEKGLIHQWEFSEGQGNILTDSAGNLNGTIHNSTWSLRTVQ